MGNEILKTIRYFDFFNYLPTVEEIYKFLGKKVTKRIFLDKLEKMVKRGLVIKHINSTSSRYTGLRGAQYTVGGHGIKQVKSYSKRQQISQEKIKKIQFYVRILSFFPQIKLIGLSGAVAMMNAKEDDDIDLFIITARNRLFAGRFIALLIAQATGIRRKRVTYTQRPSRIGSRDKVCLNLFFDESNLEVPDFKKNEYVAHEILQMKPLINKDQVYERFLEANRWVFEKFPNALNDYRRLLADFHGYPRKSVINPCKSLFNLIEVVLKKFQLFFIHRHQTTEIITSSQLWFHPEDFELKIHKLTLK